MNSDHKIQDKVDEAYNYMLTLGDFAVRFSQINRAPRYTNGDRENDVEHSYHLALSATELAADFYPELDPGLITQFSLVHDLPEIYCGDVWTIGISEEDRAKKEQAERIAKSKLIKKLPPYTAQLLDRYEKQQEPEARFVRFVDKLMPDIIHVIGSDVSTFKEDHKISELDRLEEIHEAFATKLQTMFPEFELIHKVRKKVIKTFKENVFK